MPDWHYDPSPEFVGHFAPAAIMFGGQAALDIRVGQVGGRLLSAIRQYCEANGSVLVPIPAGFEWELVGCGIVGTIDVEARYTVRITDVGLWTTVVAIHDQENLPP